MPKGVSEGDEKKRPVNQSNRISQPVVIHKNRKKMESGGTESSLGLTKDLVKNGWIMNRQF